MLPLPHLKDLVLVGGGHAHVQVLKAFAMRPLGGLRITLISREIDSPYSGMLPGYVFGDYAVDELHIDLLRLARAANARLFVAEVTSIDPQRRSICFDTNRELRYDLLSINTGAAPNCPFESPVVVPVKPIGRFLPAWDKLRAKFAPGDRLAVVGGGAGGFEIALAAQTRLGPDIGVALVTSSHLLPEHNERCRQLAATALRGRGVELHTHSTVTAIDAGWLHCADKTRIAAQAVLWVTGVAAPNWLTTTNLAQDAQGFLAVDESLRSLSHPQVFVAGDAAAMTGQPRPKSGVFAVRQGPVLAQNLRAAALGRTAIVPYRAQQRFLSLLNCADGTAIASYGRFGARSAALWRLKDWIDARFMRAFSELPLMSSAGGASAESIVDAAEASDMRCGGCGSKLNATLLDRVLRELDIVESEDVLQGIGDDAAVLASRAAPLVLTTDGFRSMVDDPFLLGRIVVHHALSDIFAMGATPSAVLLNATIPFMAEAMMEDELRQLMAGVVAALREESVPLVGGHSSEGLELSVSLTAIGHLDSVEARALSKAVACDGDAIILTKALGSGCLLAAAMRGECAGSDYLDCLAALDSSNGKAMQILLGHEVHACTDVTGFGLVGHLLEMLPGALGARLTLASLPLMSGALSLLARGIVSTLHAANARALLNLVATAEVRQAPRYQMLADPQTAGGLLASVPRQCAAGCIAALVAAGYPEATEIGVVRPGVTEVV